MEDARGPTRSSEVAILHFERAESIAADAGAGGGQRPAVIRSLDVAQF
jgi:hypothetical protein